MGGRITMSNKELDRLFVLQEAGKKRHSNTKLAERLGVRQAKCSLSNCCRGKKGIPLEMLM